MGCLRPAPEPRPERGTRSATDARTRRVATGLDSAAGDREPGRAVRGWTPGRLLLLRSRLPILASCLAIATLALLPVPVLASPPEASVVHITTFKQRPHWDEPWRSGHVSGSSGTGFVIPGNRILTNAHVVSWAKEILVRGYQRPRSHVAHVRFIAHDADLAVLEVEDPEFFAGIEALRLGGLPKVRSTVTTVGYPAGGDQISYTRGVVSRIESQPYAHIGNRSFLAVQTDAAINPGSSGGPVMQEDRVVGVAFQNRTRLENTGYFIPTSMVRHVLEDIEDGRYDGFPDAGILLSRLENDAYRRYLGLPAELDGQGARIDHILPVPSTEALLRVDDVLLAVEDHAVDSDGTVLYEGNRVHAGTVFDAVQAGESLRVELFRDGGRIEVDLPVHVYSADRAEGTQYDEPPRYFVYAGLVFLLLNGDYLAAISDGGQSALAHPHLHYALHYHAYEHPQERRQETVVLARVLPHPVNADLKLHEKSIVDRINGVRIERLDDVPRALDAEAGPFHLIEFLDGGRFATLDREAAEAAHSGIASAYGLSSDRRL